MRALWQSRRKVTVSASDGETMAWLHANSEVVDQQARDLETDYEVRISDAAWARFQNRQRRSA